MPVPAAPWSGQERLGLGVLIGAAAGLASGLFGIGGGLIIVPGLVLVMKTTQHRAHANSLGAVIPIAAAAAIPYYLGAQISLALALSMAVPAVIAARYGARLATALSERQLRSLFGLLMLVVAVRMLVGVAPTPGADVPDIGIVLVGGALIGVITGLASALLGIGGGLIMVPAMVIGLGVPQHLAEGTSLVAIIPTAISGTLVHRRSGFVSVPLVAALGAGGVIAGVIGSNIALSTSAFTLQSGMAILLILVLVRMVGPDLLRMRSTRAAGESS